MTLDEALAACPVVAILRGVRPDEVGDHARALVEAGVRAIEVPLNSPDPLASVAQLARDFGGTCVCGAGTVLTVAEVEAVAAAGGRLVVSPNTDGAVIARTVAQRTGEFAVRLALGASVRDLHRLVLGAGVRLALAGAALGVVGALGLTRLLTAAFPGIRANSFLILAFTLATLGAVALLACWLPARRASRVDALEALRAQ